MRLSDKLLDGRVKTAVKRRRIQWLLNRLIQIERAISGKVYEQMVILIGIEENELWKDLKAHAKKTWPQFLRAVCPGFGPTKYYNCKRMIDQFDPEFYREYGPDRLMAVAYFRPHEKRIFAAMDDFKFHEKRLPSVSTVRAMGYRISGKRPPDSVIISKLSWRRRYLDAKKKIETLERRLAREKAKNVVLRTKVKDLKEKLRKVASSAMAKLLKKRPKGK